jgi:hypothetical protein
LKAGHRNKQINISIYIDEIENITNDAQSGKNYNDLRKG